MEKVVILGGGESGVGAAILAKKQGYQVFLSDIGVIQQNYIDILLDNNIAFEQGEHTIDQILTADLVVKSPGIPKKADIIKQIESKQIDIISEIEFASRFTKSKIIAITGSNGKTTTASLLYHILANAGLNVALAGNIGKSFAQLVASDLHDYYVLEVSSFQLDDIQTFKPYIAILLNITPDHLDQYDYKFELYAKSKFKITENQSDEDYLVYNFDDDATLQLVKNINTNANKIPYSMKQNAEGTYADKNNIYFNQPTQYDLPIASLSLRGGHNISNSMAAATAANLLKIRKETIKRSLSDFNTVEHRLESVLKIGGVEFINDSKATNINAVYYALESMEEPTIWIVGGVDKGNDYSELTSLVKKKVRAIVCLGEDNTKIINEFEDLVENIIETNTMRDAVRSAYMLAKKGENVLLSPACASFDLFKNYEDRGNQFKKEVKDL